MANLYLEIFDKQINELKQEIERLTTSLNYLSDYCHCRKDEYCNCAVRMMNAAKKTLNPTAKEKRMKRGLPRL